MNPTNDELLELLHFGAVVLEVKINLCVGPGFTIPVRPETREEWLERLEQMIAKTLRDHEQRPTRR